MSLVIYARNYFDFYLARNIRNEWIINGAKQISPNVRIYLILKYRDENTRGRKMLV